MIFKRIDKSTRPERKKIHIHNSGQSIFEYFILTTVVVAVILFFASSSHFKNIRNSCREAFNQAVEDILE